MRQPRIKIAPADARAVYHCISRTMNGERLLDDVAKEVFRKQLWPVADYCGVHVLTYAILSNHFHVLVRVPQREDITDAELLRRFAILYPRPNRYQLAQDYRFCGYAEAVAGSEVAQLGIRSIVRRHTWPESHGHYREMIFGTGAEPREGMSSITPDNA